MTNNFPDKVFTEIENPQHSILMKSKNKQDPNVSVYHLCKNTSFNKCYLIPKASSTPNCSVQTKPVPETTNTDEEDNNLESETTFTEDTDEPKAKIRKPTPTRVKKS